jgi:hypothetical protein
MGKKFSTTKASVPNLPVAGVRVTPKSVWLIKCDSDTANKAMKIRHANATYDNDEGDIDDEDDYGDDEKDGYGDDDENDTDDDGDDVTPVAHISSKGRGQHAVTNLRKMTGTLVPSGNVRIPRCTRCHTRYLTLSL